VVLLGFAIGSAACDAQKSATPTGPTPISGEAPPSDSGTGPGPGSGGGSGGVTPPSGGGSAVVTGVGDIGWCGSPGMRLTARLLQAIPGEVLLLGDLAYMRGTTDNFARCFDPDYGQFRNRWRPSPGNHEYEDAGANGYFTYFGDAAGPGRAGYYAFRAATWNVLMLNSNQPATRGSAQYEAVRQHLQSNPSYCTMAVWHHPFATSGPNGPGGQMRDMWQLLNEHGADVVMSGHDHMYERFAPQDRDYRYDPNGIRQFIAGTGGAPVYQPRGRAPNSEAIVQSWGVLKLTLNPASYEWQFLEAQNGGVLDAGVAQCH
jgi:hypothetical protein